MTQEADALWTVVLNWKKSGLTAKCVRDLQETTYRNHSIVIVDNGSQDGSGERLRREFPNIHLIESGVNLGFSGGCNLGIRYALAHGADYIALINNDLTLEPDGYEHAMNAFSDRPTTGAVTGKIYTSDPAVIWQAGGSINHIRVSGMPRGHFQEDRKQYDQPDFTEWASGAMSIFRAAALVKIGLLPEEYFFGQEEWDFSTNLLRNEYKIAYVPSFVGHHANGASYRRHPVLNGYGGTRNRQLYAEKYLPVFGNTVWRVALWIHLRVIMPLKLRRLAEDLPEYRTHVQAMQLAFSRHTRGRPVTLEELRSVSAELGADESWAPSVTS